ncbi:MAG TPA: urease accessory protein UreE [Candidatus Scatomonas pullistercoris]|uniref:Urease accessory protein UreE n=1 Tax=Candidatus Scatomonas pullistercoris TaxID=2840920 RepID=A0A9D1T9L3_9FIRM|nr:urease accessory protein UreE [Candidatus Scatomonas pullistercoris]
MICEKIIGKLDSQKVSGKKVEYVDIDWDDAFKKIHKKTTDAGTELGIRMDDSVLTRGLQEGDILFEDADRVIAVRIPPCEVIRVRVAPDHGFMAAKVCYEIGNRHAPLFYGKDAYSFITPYNEPMLQMLSKLHGVTAKRAREKLDFDRRISSGAPGHHHH